jgi:hypothetical protein
MDPVDSAQLSAAGAAAPGLILPGCDWVHRRVQRISYSGPQLLTNRLSVDFTPPPEAPAYVPISVLPKWPPVYRLDYLRDDGTPVPLLTSAENGIIDEALLRATVEEVSPASLHSEAFAAALRTLCRGPETHLEEAFDSFAELLVGDVSDPRVERLLDIAATLTSATFLWYPVPSGRAGQRQICKLEYLIRNLESSRWHVRLRRSLSWMAPADFIPLWHIGADANFHADVEAPSVLTIRSLEPRFYWFAPPEAEESYADPADPADAPDPAASAEEDSSADSDSRRAEEVGLRPDLYLDREGRLAHVYVSRRRPLGADLIATFAATRSAIAPMAGAGLVIAALATAFYSWREQIDMTNDVAAAVSVLILIPALLAYVVIRPSDPPEARRYLQGVQALALAAGAVPLVMAVMLLHYAHDPGCLTTAWLWSERAAYLIAAMLTFSFLRAGNRDGPIAARRSAVASWLRSRTGVGRRA